MRSDLQEVWHNKPKLNALNSISKVVPSWDPKEQGVGEVDTVEVAGVWMDLVKVKVNTEDYLGKRQILPLKDVASEKKTKEVSLHQVIHEDPIKPRTVG